MTHPAQSRFLSVGRLGIALLFTWVDSVVMDGGWSQGDDGGTSPRRLSCFLPGARMVGRGLTGSDAGFWAEVRAD
ncbi:hypothetical protein [Streptomyces sp. 3211]|uniref:hypothetical protein n=1 Tax=Streptomyces sp. 3211 TaxID=1964449 RepID=UPI0013312E82|nr:hypothetical protein [Streptomyces sp. 3211]